MSVTAKIRCGSRSYLRLFNRLLYNRDYPVLRNKSINCSNVFIPIHTGNVSKTLFLFILFLLTILLGTLPFYTGYC